MSIFFFGFRVFRIKIFLESLSGRISFEIIKKFYSIFITSQRTQAIDILTQKHLSAVSICVARANDAQNSPPPTIQIESERRFYFSLQSRSARALCVSTKMEAHIRMIHMWNETRNEQRAAPKRRVQSDDDKWSRSSRKQENQRISFTSESDEYSARLGCVYVKSTTLWSYFSLSVHELRLLLHIFFGSQGLSCRMNEIRTRSVVITFRFLLGSSPRDSDSRATHFLILENQQSGGPLTRRGKK